MTDPSERLARLKLQLLKRQIHQASQEREVLKAAVRDEVDLVCASRRTEKLQRKLAQLKVAEQNLGSRLCFGPPPDWVAGSSSQAEWSGQWLCGVEVLYSAGLEGQQLRVSLSDRPVELQLYARPFAHGGVRMAFYAKDKARARYVLKRALVERSTVKKRVRDMHADAEAAAISHCLAHAFNNAAGAAAGDVSYLTASVVVLQNPSEPNGKAVYLKEPWLDTVGCKWVKWTRNDGYVYPECEAEATIQALTHFSLLFLRKHSSSPGMLLDAQGIKMAKSGRASFTLTDPAICTLNGRYAQTDFDPDAIKSFLSKHSCGALCSEVSCAGLSL